MRHEFPHWPRSEVRANGFNAARSELALSKSFYVNEMRPNANAKPMGIISSYAEDCIPSSEVSLQAPNKFPAPKSETDGEPSIAGTIASVSASAQRQVIVAPKR